MNKIVALPCVALVAACAGGAPKHINDVCSVFDQRDGWFSSWQSSAESTERKYGIPVSVLMATVRKESGFKGNARPPRKKLLGFIPWKRQSSAYGYSQALNGTWAQYVKETGSWGARRNRFSDAIDFVGWYHAKTADTYGVEKNDTFRLYLAYYLGWSGFARGNWDDGVQRYARDTDEMARRYEAQLSQCR